MDNEIKHPDIDVPVFAKEPYDYRNMEKAGHYRGVGEAGKVGGYRCTSYDPMPPKKHSMKVPRDHE